ncbi:RNA polymerase sigma factor [Pedobacter helvus]|uniref:RNA polymerase sigma factor n=1 Tax=Pedobacter helvus TaxID=2563444 RepID=A0ABW9JFR3_9SPHI|nr:RNA polymerase sigma factor [Pedobacter ureilyticus]
MEDQELVKRLLNGDNSAFTLLVKNTEGLVAQIVFKMVDSLEDRRDLVQDVYLNAYKYIRNFKSNSKLSTWVGSIAYHACYNYLKKKKLLLPEKQLEDENEDVLETMTNRFIDHSSSEIMEYIIKKELRSVLQIGIDQLPPIYATLIALYHFQEMSYQEISEITSLPEGTLKNYLFRARKKLKDYVVLNYKKEDL